MFVMTGALPAHARFGSFWVAHLLVAVSFLWVAADLVRWGSLVGARRRPHPSLLALCGALVARYLTGPSRADRYLEVAPLFTIGLIILGGALAVLAMDDRRRDPLLGLSGRLLLVSGGATLAVAELHRMVQGLTEHPAYALGVGGAGMLLGAMAGFEARLLCRAAALAAHGASEL